MSSITHEIGKSVSQGANNMIFWRSNFNMPVPNLAPQNTTVMGSVATSFDLSGYVPGLEICLGTFSLSLDGPLVGTVHLLFGWFNPSGSLLGSAWNSWNFNVNIPPATTIPYTHYGMMNVGCAFWEIAQNATYTFRTYLTGAITLSKITNVTFSNVPSTTQLDPSTQGHMWVEGNYLAFVNYNQWVHRILGTDLGFVLGQAGHIWVDNLNDVHYIDLNSHDRRLPWKIKQFASYFFNSATSAIFAGTDKAGHVWMDGEYGKTHLAYIGKDGWKYIAGAGDYPY
jgi:hypothetical protein